MWVSMVHKTEYWRKYVHEVLVNRLGGLSLPRKSVVRLTDRPDMTLAVYRGRKTTIQLYNNRMCFVVCIPFLYSMKKCKCYVHELVIKSYSSISNQLNVHVVVLL